MTRVRSPWVLHEVLLATRVPVNRSLVGLRCAAFASHEETFEVLLMPFDRPKVVLNQQTCFEDCLTDR